MCHAVLCFPPPHPSPALQADALNLSLACYGAAAMLTDVYWASAFSPWARTGRGQALAFENALGFAAPCWTNTAAW